MFAEKLKSLQKYIEPLQKRIHDMEMADEGGWSLSFERVTSLPFQIAFMFLYFLQIRARISNVREF